MSNNYVNYKFCERSDEYIGLIFMSVNCYCTFYAFFLLFRKSFKNVHVTPSKIEYIFISICILDSPLFDFINNHVFFELR